MTTCLEEEYPAQVSKYFKAVPQMRLLIKFSWAGFITI